MDTFRSPSQLPHVFSRVIGNIPTRFYQSHRERVGIPGQWKFPLEGRIYEILAEGLKGQIEIDPVLKSKMEAYEKERLETEMLKGGYSKVELPKDYPFVTQPFPHQRIAASLLYNKSAFGLFMDMGTGKTKVILDHLASIRQLEEREGKPHLPALVITPLSVVEVWPRQAAQHQPGLRVVPLIKGSTEVKGQAVDALYKGKLADIFVVNYESAWRIEQLKKLRWGTVILDEATKIKHRSSLQARGAMEIGLHADRRYILTGTPTPNNPLEIWNQIRFLGAMILGSSFYAFRNRYAITGGYGGHEIVGWKHLDELAAKIAGVSYTVKKKDCLKDLPEKVYEEVRVAIPKDWMRSYKQMARDLVTEISGTTIAVNIALAKMTKLRQMANGFIYAPDTENLVLKVDDKNNWKLNALAEILEEQMMQGNKMVWWGSFREELNMMERLLEKKLKPGQWIRFDGSTPSGQRGDLVEKFQTDENCKIFLGQQHAGGMGITLTAANYCVFFSNDYSPEIRLQAEDRLHRVGQKNAVTYIDLVARGTIDLAIIQSLKTKQRLSAIIESAGLEEVLYGKSEDLADE